MTTLFYLIITFFSDPIATEDLWRLKRNAAHIRREIRLLRSELDQVQELLALREASIRGTADWAIRMQRWEGAHRKK
jgi:hypothetical protein